MPNVHGSSKVPSQEPPSEYEGPPSDISAVVCVKNGEATIEQLLVSLKAARMKEIIVVDGLSRDATLEICKRYANMIISDGGNGLAYARQIGAESAKGEVILYIDADVRFTLKDIFLEMLSEMTEKGWAAINPQVVDTRDGKNLWEEAQDLYYRDTFNSPVEKRYLIGMAFMVRRDIVLRFTFDPFFTFGSEDTDFFHRLGKEGYRLGVSRHKISHLHRSSFRDFARQKIAYGVGDMNFIFKHKVLKNITTPTYILVTGIRRSIRFRRPSHVLFYVLWTSFLHIGMMKGFFLYLARTLIGRRKGRV
jgi:glycosyltransferase involved in cell wall biosynthesis